MISGGINSWNWFQVSFDRLNVGATHHARNGGSLLNAIRRPCSRITSQTANRVFPQRRPAATTRVRALLAVTNACPG